MTDIQHIYICCCFFFVFFTFVYYCTASAFTRANDLLHTFRGGFKVFQNMNAFPESACLLYLIRDDVNIPQVLVS